MPVIGGSFTAVCYRVAALSCVTNIFMVTRRHFLATLPALPLVAQSSTALSGNVTVGRGVQLGARVGGGGSSADYPIASSVLRISDGSTSHMDVSDYGYVKWATPYGDWADSAGTYRGTSSPFAAMSVSSTGTKTVDITSMVQGWYAGTWPNNGLMLVTLNGTQTNFASHEVGGGAPSLAVTLSDSSVVTVTPSADTYLATDLASHGTETAFKTTSGQPGCLWFDLSSVTKSVTSAILTLTVTTVYSPPASIAVVRTDLSRVLPTLAVNTGIAYKYTNDVGLENDASVLFMEKFPDLLVKTGRAAGKQWTADIPALTGFQGIVGNADAISRYAKYRPLAPGLTALKTGVPANSSVNTSQSFLLYPNIGHEVDEAYVRYYIFFYDSWDGGTQGGKLPGFFCNYNKSGGGLKPGAPAQGGNGGAPTFGFGGWTARGGFSPKPTGSPVFDAGYCNVYFGDIYTPPDHMPDVVNSNYGGYYREGASYNTYGAQVPWNARGLLKKNQWHCVEIHVKMNSIDTSGATKAYFGNTYQASGNFAGMTLQYRSGASTPQGSDTLIKEYTQLRYGNNSGYFYVDGSDYTTYCQDMGLYGGKDTATLTSPGVGKWDGLVEVWIDGQLTFQRPNWLLRHIAKVQIQAFGLTIQHGGTGSVAYNQDFCVTNIVVATRYIGPMKRA
jgi:hypothetical protein